MLITPNASSALLLKLWYWKSLIFMGQYEFALVIPTIQQIVAVLSTFREV